MTKTLAKIAGVAVGALYFGVAGAAALIDLHSTPDGTVIQIGDAYLQHDTKIQHSQKTEFWWVDQDRNGDELFTGLNSNDTPDSGGAGVAPNDADFNGNKTYPIAVSDLFKTSDGAYYAFVFDANQMQCNDADLVLRCDHVDFATLDFYSSADLYADITALNAADMIWSLDELADNTLRIDGNIGMGGADMYLYLPVAGLNWSTYLYIHGVYTNGNDGQETWATGAGLPNPAPIPAPEPGSLALLGIGLIGLAVSRRHKQ